MISDDKVGIKKIDGSTTFQIRRTRGKYYMYIEFRGREKDKRLNLIRRTNMLSIFSDRVVSDQSEQIVVGSTRRSCVSNPFECIELSERCSRDERNFLLSHSPSIVTPHMSIADSRADKTSLLDILLRVHSVYLRNTRRIMYRRLQLV